MELGDIFKKDEAIGQFSNYEKYTEEYKQKIDSHLKTASGYCSKDYFSTNMGNNIPEAITGVNKMAEDLSSDVTSLIADIKASCEKYFKEDWEKYLREKFIRYNTALTVYNTAKNKVVSQNKYLKENIACEEARKALNSAKMIYNTGVRKAREAGVVIPNYSEVQ